MILRNFVVFEGIDGAGTSTQIRLLKDRAEAERFFFTAEPTELETGKFLRKMLNGNVSLDPRTSAYLFAADRAEHLWGKGGIEEKCREGKIAVSDRYLFSSLAYQSVTCGDELPALLNSRFPLPQLMFFFKIDPKISLARVDSRGKREIYENVEFLESTEKRYEQIIASFKARNDGMKISVIDASKPKEEVRDEIWEELSKLL